MRTPSEFWILRTCTNATRSLGTERADRVSRDRRDLLPRAAVLPGKHAGRLVGVRLDGVVLPTGAVQLLARRAEYLPRLGGGQFDANAAVVCLRRDLRPALGILEHVGLHQVGLHLPGWPELEVFRDAVGWFPWFPAVRARILRYVPLRRLFLHSGRQVGPLIEAVDRLTALTLQQRIEHKHPQALPDRDGRTDAFDTTLADGAENRRHRRLGVDKRVVASKHPHVVRIGVRNQRLAEFLSAANGTLVRIEPTQMNLRVLDRIKQIHVTFQVAFEALAAR